MFPLIGFLIGCIGFTFLGIIALKFLPSFRLTIVNLIVFVMGAFPGALLLTMAFKPIYYATNIELTNNALICMMLSMMLLGGIIGGLCIVKILEKIRKTTK